mgnify:CR=1 FL=1
MPTKPPKEKTKPETEESGKDLDEDEKENHEEDLELNLRNLEFHQFMQPSEKTSAPVLEKIADTHERPIFVGELPQTSQTIPGEEEKRDVSKYVASARTNEEPKYIASDSRISQEINQINIMEAGRRQPETFQAANQQAFFEQFSERKSNESPMVEKTGGTERLDFERAGRRDPLETQDTKYEKKYRPDLPSSR